MMRSRGTGIMVLQELLTLLIPQSEWVWPLCQGVWSQGVPILVASPSLNRTLPLSGSNCMSCQTLTHLIRENAITDFSQLKTYIHTFSRTFTYVHSTLWNDMTLSSLYWHLYRCCSRSYTNKVWLIVTVTSIPLQCLSVHLLT